MTMTQDCFDHFCLRRCGTWLRTASVLLAVGLVACSAMDVESEAGLSGGYKVQLSSPDADATVNGTATLAASVTPISSQTENAPVAGVQFQVDEVNIGSQDAVPPYDAEWDTTAFVNGEHTVTAVVYDTGGGSASDSVNVTVSNNLPPLPPGADTLTIPSADDERSTYTKWGWSWSADQEPEAVREPIANYTVSDVDLHGDTEGDDLWTYLMMYRRSGNPVYYYRALAWADYFKQYRGSDEYRYDEGFLHDHMYGWGLVEWYRYTCEQGTCDDAALLAAEALAGDVEAYWSTRMDNDWPVPGEFRMAYYSLRQGARHLLLAAYLAEETGKQRWVELRDRLTELWMQSPDWDSRGMYFHGDWQTDNYLGEGTYAAGGRYVSTFQIGILAEAFFHVWRATLRSDIRQRLVDMAKFVNQYALEPNCDYAASSFGIVDGKPWYSYTCGEFWDPVYTTSLVNTLVLAYKLTGERAYYDRAKHFFNRGTKGVYGSSTERAAADDAVAHFVDTKFSSATGDKYLDYNRGELQYTYLIFENGGL